MTTSTTLQVANRINKIYQANKYYLSGTASATAVNTYLGIDDPKRSDLDTLRASLNTHKNALSPSQINIYNAVNNLLTTVENEFIFEQVGSSTLSSNFKTEDANGITFASIRDAIVTAIGSSEQSAATLAAAIVNAISGPDSTENDDLITKLTNDITGGTATGTVSAEVITTLTTNLNNLATPSASNIASTIIDGTIILNGNTGNDLTTLETAITTYEVSDDLVTATSAIGTNDISSVSSSDDNTLTGIVGNTPLTDFTLLGSATSASGSLSAEIESLKNGVETAIGTSAIAPESAFTGKACTYDGASYSLGSTIFTTSNVLSTTVNNIIACGKWASSAGDHYFSTTGLVGGCSGLLDPGQAFALCIDYLAVTP